jgi:rhodanese-related sulfurtransferase
MQNAVSEIPAAPRDLAIEHFQSLFAFETDCFDTHAAFASGDPGFVLVDARSPALFAKGHVPGAINIPHAKIIGSRMGTYKADTLFVTYCAGPHCNSAARAAIRLARLGFPVKLMTGGVTGWLDEGYELAVGDGAG